MSTESRILWVGKTHSYRGFRCKQGYPCRILMKTEGSKTKIGYEVLVNNETWFSVADMPPPEFFLDVEKIVQEAYRYDPTLPADQQCIPDLKGEFTL